MTHLNRQPTLNDSVITPTLGRCWLRAFGITALVVAIPVTTVALWAGVSKALLLAESGNLTEQLCSMVRPEPLQALARAQELEEALRNRLDDALERIARDRGRCSSPGTAAGAPPPLPPSAVALPQERWNSRDVSVIAGCWDRVSNMVVLERTENKSHAVKSWHMCFDQTGHGYETLEFDAGGTCRGDIIGSFGPDGRMVLDARGGMRCDGSMTIDAMINQCSRTGDEEADCIGFDPKVPDKRVPSKFRRATSSGR